MSAGFIGEYMSHKIFKKEKGIYKYAITSKVRENIEIEEKTVFIDTGHEVKNT